LRAAGSTERGVLVDGSPKGQVESNYRKPTCTESDRIRSERVTAVRLKGVTMQYVKDDGEINQNDRHCTDKEKGPATAPELV
jgi:hypothetical protein